MKNLYYFLFVFVITSCNKNKTDNENIESHDNFYPNNFIVVKSQINTEVNKETDEILEYITKQDPTITYLFNCPPNSKGQSCNGKYKEVKTDIFFNFDSLSKKISVVNKYNYLCNCEIYGEFEEDLQQIDLNEIYAVDTITNDRDFQNNKITSVVIKPKYNNESIQYKTIRKAIDKEGRKTFIKDSGYTKMPIFIKMPQIVAGQFKDKLEKLISQYNRNYSISQLDNSVIKKVNYESAPNYEDEPNYENERIYKKEKMKENENHYSKEKTSRIANDIENSIRFKWLSNDVKNTADSANVILDSQGNIIE